jgi:hypothetical protein
VESSSTGDSRLRGALPKPDSCSAAKTGLFKQLVGAAGQGQRNGDAERLGGL